MLLGTSARVLRSCIAAHRPRIVLTSSMPLRSSSEYFCRNFSTTRPVSHGNHMSADAKDVRVVFVLKDGSERELVGKEGQSILDVAHAHDVDLEGACEASIACSTCHVILDDTTFDALPDACEREDDMLDMAFGLTPTSRLGCQVFLTPELDGMRVKLPKATRNMYVDGHKPKPH